MGAGIKKVQYALHTAWLHPICPSVIEPTCVGQIYESE
jgi:hypothetical protein